MKGLTGQHSRLNKLFVEEGRGGFAEAEDFFGRLTLRIHVNAHAAQTPAGQAAALTAVATACRCFRGGVFLTGATQERLLLPLPYQTILEAAKKLGAIDPKAATCTIVIGDNCDGISGWLVKACWDGWIAGVYPSDSGKILGTSSNTLAGVASGSLAVAQAFSYAKGDLRAGRFVHAVSLWNLLDSSDRGEPKVFLPKSLWILGLGNLGQAYLWALSLLPFARPGDIELMLHDFDIVKAENWGTSILTSSADYGMLKTRMAENWALQRGFFVRRVDRPFDECLRRHASETPWLLSGLDSLKARRLLGAAGFDYIVDCGLGATAQDYHVVRMNVFDKNKTPEKHFSGIVENPSEQTERIKALPIFQKELQGSPHEACGIAEIAGASVAVPFVSALAGAISIAQIIRMSSGLAPVRSLALSVDSIEDAKVYQDPSLNIQNPIYSEVWNC